ncbi:MAG TPA: DUF1015 domain-containing protein [Candidatus Limnocylindria bacterium]|jgi:uncharacterized protein (DUF1015 family)|nr:DUF1015 domain-containing protein [Candidatus Limnocylindria bacterium]
MPTLRPFRGLGYALDRYASPAPAGMRIADLTEVVCPPYDVITPAQQVELLERSQRNAVRLELSAQPDPHAAAAATLRAWQGDGTLEGRAEPSVYYYRHARPAAPDQPSVSGVVARLLLEPLGTGVRAHEHTLAGPKADRLALLEATRTQLSPILAIYFDRSAHHDHLLGLPWSDEWRARDGDGLLHSLAAIEPDARLVDHLSRQQLYIADGHHRYETALAYQAAIRSLPAMADAEPGSLAADWIMVVLVNAEREELEIQATHRLIRNADDDALRSLIRDPDPIWQAIPVAPGELAARLAQLQAAEQPVFGLVLPGDEGFLLVGDTDAADDRMRREPMSAAVRGLDLAILHVSILDDRLGIEPGTIATGDALAYTRSAADAIRAVASGEAKAAILVRPTRLEQLAAVASAGDVMPQKSTYFYPKLLTGLVFYPLEGE